MDWYSIGVATVSGGLAGGISALILHKIKIKNKGLATTIGTVILFFIINTLSKQYILPTIFPHKIENDIISAFDEIPAFASIKKYEPETYNTLVRTYVDSTKKGLGKQKIIDLMKSKLSVLVMVRLKNASDDAILAYIGIMLEEITFLEAMKNDYCFKYLFPDVSGGINITKIFSTNMQQKDLAALDEIIKTSNVGRPLPSEDEVMLFLQPIFISLYQKYGNDIAMLDNPEGENIDRLKICSMTKNLYDQILELPREQSLATIRWMFAQNIGKSS